MMWGESLLQASEEFVDQKIDFKPSEVQKSLELFDPHQLQRIFLLPLVNISSPRTLVYESLQVKSDFGSKQLTMLDDVCCEHELPFYCATNEAYTINSTSAGC
jgi:hypothetical protein